MPDPFGPALIAKLVPAVAKAILKLWLGEGAEIANAAAGAGIDVLVARLPNGQGPALKTVDALAESLTERICAAMAEAPGATRDDLEPVIAAAGDALDAADLDLPGLLRLSLSSDRLKVLLRDAGEPFRRDLEERMRSQFDRVVALLAKELPVQADKLPSFAAHSTAEVLRRLDELPGALAAERARAQRDERSDADREFERLYRDAAVKQLDRMVLFGLNVDRENQRYPLSVAYVRLSVSLDAPAEEGDEDDERGLSSETVPAEELLGRSPRLLIRGEPGSGKTTLLCWLAVQSAGRRFKEELAAWNEAVPFFLPLRKYVVVPDSGDTAAAKLELPKLQAFVDEAAALISEVMPAGWVYRQLRSGRALVLVDGIDEVPEGPLREEVRDWIAGLCEQFPDAGFVTSSRPYLPEKWLGASGFGDFSVEPLSLDDAYQLIDRWHEAVARQVDGEEQARLPGMCANLKAELRRNRPVRMLATNPLLCAMICALHRQKDEQLPNDRIELYQTFCDTLLDTRDRDRKVPVPYAKWLVLRYKQALVQDLAWWMLSNGYVQVTATRAQECLERRLEKLPNRPEVLTAERALRYLIERTGLLREPESGKIDFTHKTFMEFLAAQAGMRDDQVGVLVQHAADDGWQETIKLAAGSPGDEKSGRLIEELIRRGDEDEAKRHRLYLLAAACAEVSLSGGAFQQQLADRITGLVPPKNMTEARALAAAGELAIPYLAAKKMRAQWAACCVRTLGLIGGEEAALVLEQYGTDARATVREELVLAADAFDEELGKRILTGIPSDWRPDPLRVAAILARVRKSAELPLSYDGRWAVTNLDKLSGLTSLQTLDLSRCGNLTNLEPLAGLVSLEALNLSRCWALTNLRPLAGLTSLQTLDLSYCSQLTDVGPLAGLVSLEALNLSGCWELTNLSPLAGLTSLQTLNLSGCSGLVDVGPLVGLVSLRTLDLSWCSQLTDVSALEGLPNLRRLVLRGTPARRKLGALASKAGLELILM